MSFEPGGFFFNRTSAAFGIPYYTLTVSINVIVTVLIVYRLHKVSKVARETLGEESAKLYTGIAAMLIESAAPYSLTGIMFLIPYARGDAVAVAIGQVWAKFTVRDLCFVITITHPYLSCT